tara:strand:+ start:2314 stop:2898 length:585 start_codon:yes stop_codon:yes gene_type:complete
MFSKLFFKEVSDISNSIDYNKIENLALELKNLRDIKKGRLFICGVGGSAGNASHAVNDFRKLCNIEAYAPTDNVSELTARTNDEGWETVFSEWIEVSKAKKSDSILIFSVGGGNAEKNVSLNLVNLIKKAKEIGMRIYGIVGKVDGFTAKEADILIHIPCTSLERVTPHSESFQAVVWHCLVSHPDLQLRSTKW